jgi:ribonuclease R
LDGSFVPEQEFSHYKEMAIKSSEREASAVEAERESIKLKQVEYMSSRVGQTFSGTITGVTDWGIFIEEKKTKSEGVARLRDLKDNYYVLDKGNFRLIGQKKKTYTLGDKVNMKLSSTDLESKTIDWKII